MISDTSNLPVLVIFEINDLTEIKNKHLYRNGVQLYETYINDQDWFDEMDYVYKVPADESAIDIERIVDFPHPDGPIIETNSF